mmetsp:Transcript_6082/g.6918  ORF Transcript_6082/g.6918 Transcript_6082/m.6918 type:complete len:89 (+) Transcript_6082:1414-1680(+)
MYNMMMKVALLLMVMDRKKNSQGSISPIKAINSQDDVNKASVDTDDRTDSTRDLIADDHETGKISSLATGEKERQQTHNRPLPITSNS